MLIETDWVLLAWLTYVSVVHLLFKVLPEWGSLCFQIQNFCSLIFYVLLLFSLETARSL